MTRIVVSASVSTREVSAPDPHDSWSRADTDGEITNVIAYVDQRSNSYYGSSHCTELDVKPGGTVYAVVADYETGDSFGRDGCQAQVLDAFLTEKEAEGLVDAARNVPDTPGIERYGFTYNGREYSRSWVGYFERLKDITIWECTVREHPADPFRVRKGTDTYSRRQGS